MVGAVLLGQGPVFCCCCARRMDWLKAEAWRRVLTLWRRPIAKKKGPAPRRRGTPWEFSIKRNQPFSFASGA